MSTSIAGMESTYTELKEFKFTEFQIDGSQDYGYYKALAKLKKLKPFEDAGAFICKLFFRIMEAALGMGHTS
ncbi:hypothetical protein CEXT_744261 [Caerostris extrusa]|uniref:Uncharacterized protein n=1 Tax=Caerostris extrusa TaxID=172846 RepID=A0AAV4N2H1_CAEEX|nr:hypothetical protein CEXT_744261 [Caerostris extrusa]